VAGFTYEPWTGIYAPAATPKEIIGRLNTEVRKASSQPDLVKRWASEGLEARDYAPGEIAAALRTENAGHAKVIRELGIKID
jgi:tripartite-type tricarboxylate transporter receptor subunit TctC